MSEFTLLFNTGIQIVTVKMPDAQVTAIWTLEHEPIIAPTSTTDEAARARAAAIWNALAEIDWPPSTASPAVRINAGRTGLVFEFTVAVDTTAGDSTAGFLGTVSTSVPVLLKAPAGVIGDPLSVCTIRMLTGLEAGEPIPVTLVLDIGNSRTSALVIEDHAPGDSIHSSSIAPLALGPVLGQSLSCVIPSSMEFRPPKWPQASSSIAFDVRTTANPFWRRIRSLVRYDPYLTGHYWLAADETFRDPSISEVGSPALVAQKSTGSSPGQTGLSSPKRYLWDANTPTGSWCFVEPKTFAHRPISGPPVAFMSTNDNDDWLVDGAPVGRERPTEARFPRRAMMTIFLFELIQRCHQTLNSHAHRTHAVRSSQVRHVRHLVLTYPSAMSLQEVQRLKAQAAKATRIFQSQVQRTDGEIEVHADVDEGVAVHLAFIAAQPPTASERIAALDIGGGTIDLAVASHSRTQVAGERLCRVELIEGAYVGGDDVVRKIISDIILPSLAAFSKGEEAVRRCFAGAPQGELLGQRSRFIKHVLVPLAHECLRRQAADGKAMGDISADICDSDVLSELSQRLRQLMVHQNAPLGLQVWSLRPEPAQLQEVIDSVMGSTLKRFSECLVASQVSRLLLAGKLADQPRITQIVRASGFNGEIVELRNHRELQALYHSIFGAADKDPKALVSVGAALGWIAKSRRSPTGSVLTLDYSQVSGEFQWGIVDPLTKTFALDAKGQAHIFDWVKDTTELEFDGRQFIGRRLRVAGQAGSVVPRYTLSTNARSNVILRRVPSVAGTEETIEILPSPNGRGTLLARSAFDDTYWLDSGDVYS